MATTKQSFAKREHELSHMNDDPDCPWCEYDWLGEAQRIVEGKTMKLATRRHLEAAFDRIDELEARLAIAEAK